MQARMTQPAVMIPEAMKALYALSASAKQPGLPSGTIDLVALRASQINGCGFCVDMHARDLAKAGETSERLFAVAAWRDAPYFTDAERALAGLLIAIATINAWNRLNVPTRQVAGGPTG